MLEKFAEKHLGSKSITGRALVWYGEKVVIPLYERLSSRKLNLNSAAERPQVGGLTEDQALQRFKVFKQSPGLQAELQDLLAHTIKGK